MPQRKSPAAVAPLNLIPFVSVVFLQLAFLLLAIRVEDATADLRVKLPRDVLARPPRVQPTDELEFTLGDPPDAPGNSRPAPPVLSQAGRTIPWERLPQHLEAVKRARQTGRTGARLDDVTVIIHADPNVPTGLVQQFVHSCQSAGFSRFSLKPPSVE